MTQALDRKTPPALSEFSSLSLPGMRTTILENGLTLNIIDYGSQEVSRVTAIWNGGKAETSDNPAAMNLATAMLREGTSTMTGHEISEALDHNGAWFIPSVYDHTTMVHLFSLNSKFDEPIEILRQIITDSVFPENEFLAYREQSAQTMAMNLQKVSYLCNIERSKLVLGEKHPLSATSSPDDIRNVTPDDVKAAYSRIFHASLPTVYLSGRISPEIEEKAIAAFSSLPFPNVDFPLNIQPFSPAADHRKSVKVEKAVQTAISFTLPTIGRRHPDYINLRLLMTLLGGFFGSRLTKNIREDKGYTYGISAGLLGMREGGLIEITTQCGNDYTEPVIDEVRKELHRLSTDGFSPDEVSTLRKYALSNLATTLDSPFSISEAYQLKQHYDSPDDYFARQFEAASNLSESTLTEIARQYIDPDKFHIVTVGG